MKYKGKKLCKECKSMYHPDNYPTCFDCYSKKPANTVMKYAKVDWNKVDGINRTQEDYV